MSITAKIETVRAFIAASPSTRGRSDEGASYPRQRGCLVAQTDATRQRQVEAALIDAAGKLARSGKCSFDEIVVKLSGGGFAGVDEFLNRPHLADALRRLCDAARPTGAEPD